MKYFDANTLSHEVSDEDNYKLYDSYIARQVYYDSLTGKLLLCGMYKSLSQSGKAPVTDGKFTFVYDISKPSSVKLFCQPYFTESKGYWTNIQTFLSKDVMFAGGSFEGKVDVETGERDAWNLSYGDSSDTVIMSNYKNNLYYYTYSSNIGYIDGQIFKYDFSEGGFVSISDTIFSKAFGQNGNSYYFMGISITDKDDDTEFFKVDLDKTLDAEWTEYTDMAGIDYLSEYFYVVNDDAIILYDRDMKAFRILEKVQGDIPERTNPYRVDDEFYIPYSD